MVHLAANSLARIVIIDRIINGMNCFFVIFFIFVIMSSPAITLPVKKIVVPDLAQIAI
jgi:hypothetical protein